MEEAWEHSCRSVTIAKPPGLPVACGLATGHGEEELRLPGF